MVANRVASIAAPRIRLAHVWSHDVGIPASLPFVRPLVGRGWDISFICPPGEHGALATREGMRVQPLALRRDFHPPSDVIGATQLVRYFRGDRPHIVHTHAFKTGHLARVLAYATRVPIVIHTVHGQPYSLETPALRRKLLAAIEWLVSVRVDAILVQGEEDGRTLIETGAVPAERVTWIGNGIDLRRFEPASPAARARRDDRRVRLAVAGDIDIGKADALDPAVLDEARAAGVLLLGRRADMPRLYAASDVVVLASWREGLPRVLMEGAAMGKPLLASDVRGCREVVKPPRNGLLVPVGDAGALAQAMLALAADPEQRARWGADNAVEARARYDLDAVVPRVFAVYDRLLRERGLA